jgi:hypothetical protein
MGVLGWNELSDYVKLVGTVVGTDRSEDGDWILKIRPDAESQPLLVNSHGNANDDGIVECEVEPSDFFDDDIHEQIYFGPLQNRHVTVVGTWVEDKSHGDKTEIHPITTVLAERTFNDAKTVYLTVFSDDSGNFPANVPHSGENRIGDFRILFPPVPVVPHYDQKPVFTIEFQKNHARSADFWIEVDASGQPFLVGIVQSGNADENRGVYIARIYLSYNAIAKLIPMNVIPPSPRLRISCVEHTNSRSQRGPTHARFISAVGGFDGTVFWKLSHDVVIYLIRSGQKTFFVQGSDGSAADVQIIAAHREAHDEFFFDHLATVADSTTTNNLSSLPKCPLYTDEL